MGESLERSIYSRKENNMLPGNTSDTHVSVHKQCGTGL